MEWMAAHAYTVNNYRFMVNGKYALFKIIVFEGETFWFS